MESIHSTASRLKQHLRDHSDRAPETSCSGLNDTATGTYDCPGPLPGTAGENVYQALNIKRHNFRLLRVLSGVDSNLLACEIGVFSLSDSLEFQAPSYCWEHHDPLCLLVVDGIRFVVRRNLYVFLKLLRQEAHRGWIFVDAICINQADVAERNQQVVLMGDIYRNASEVVAWLGDTGKHITSVPDVQEACNAFHDEVRDQDVDAYAPEPFGQAIEQALASDLAVRDYWTRLWVAQELILARSVLLRWKTLKLD